MVDDNRPTRLYLLNERGQRAVRAHDVRHVPAEEFVLACRKKLLSRNVEKSNRLVGIEDHHRRSQRQQHRGRSGFRPGIGEIQRCDSQAAIASVARP